MADPTKPLGAVVEQVPPVTPADSPFYLGPTGGLGVRAENGDIEIPAGAVDSLGLGGEYRKQKEAAVRPPEGLGAPPASAGNIADPYPPAPVPAPPPPVDLPGGLGTAPPNVGALTDNVPGIPQPPPLPPASKAAPKPVDSRFTTDVTPELPTDATYPRGHQKAGQPRVLENQGRSLENQSTQLKETAVNTQTEAELEGNQILSGASGKEKDIWNQALADTKRVIDPIRNKYENAVDLTRRIRDEGAFSHMTGGQIAATFLVAFLSGGSSRYKGDEVTNILKGVVERKVSANDKLMESLRQQMSDERAAIDAGVAMGLNALIKETDEKLKNVRDQGILAKWMVQRAEIKDAAAALTYRAEAREEVMAQQATDNAFKAMSIQAKARGKGGGGGASPGGLSGVDPTSVHTQDGIVFMRKEVGPDGAIKWVQAPGLDVDKGPGAAEVTGKIRSQVLLAKAYADTASTIDKHYGYFRNLVTDRDKVGAAQLGSALIARIITEGGRALSDADREAYEAAMGPLKDPQKFFTLLDSGELKSLAHQARDAQIRGVEQLIGSHGYQVVVTGKPLPVENKSKDNQQPTRAELKASIEAADVTPDGSRKPESPDDIANRGVLRAKYKSEDAELVDSPFIQEALRLAENTDEVDLPYVQTQLENRLEALKKENPELYDRTNISMFKVFSRIKERLRKHEKEKAPTKRPDGSSPGARAKG